MQPGKVLGIFGSNRICNVLLYANVRCFRIEVFFVWIWILINTTIHICRYMFMCIGEYVCMYAYICVYTSTRIYACSYPWIYTRINIHAYKRVYIYLCIYTRIYITPWLQGRGRVPWLPQVWWQLSTLSFSEVREYVDITDMETGWFWRWIGRKDNHWRLFTPYNDCA